MKTLLKGLAMLILLFSSYSICAQSSNTLRTPMFKSAGERIPAAISELEKAFSAKNGTEVSFKFKNFAFTGIVISSVKKYDNLYSATIEIPSMKNTLLSISKRINDDRTITYVGRMINDKSTDGYELIKNTDGSYTFHKILTEDLIQDY